jgi:hypothetical protein
LRNTNAAFEFCFEYFLFTIVMPDLTPDQIADIDYPGAVASAKGFAKDDYKYKHFLLHGEPCRAWAGYLVPEGTPGRERNGRLYEELMLAPDVRVVISNTETEVYGTEFGVALKGSTRIRTLADELELARGDRVLLTGKHRWILARTLVTRGAAPIQGQPEEADELPHHFVQDIRKILIGDQIVDSSRYRVSQDAEQWGIEWLDPPPDGTEYSTAWRFAPLFYFAGQENRQSPADADGERLMQQGVLTLELS